MKYGNVHLIDLPKNEVLLKISRNLKNKFSEERKRYFKSMEELANLIDENENTLIGFFWHDNTIPVRLLLKFVKLFKIKSYENEIIWMGGQTQGKGIKNPKIPFNFNTEEGGKFIAAVLGDGTFLHNFEIQYRNYCPLMLDEVMNTARKLFGDIQIIRRDDTAITFPAVLGRIIKILGLKQGRKTVTNPSIPKFIINGSKECKMGFLKQISDDEASAQIKPPYSYSIRYEFAREIPYDKISEREKYVPDLLKDLHKLVRELGYSTTNIYGGRVYRGRRKPRFIVSWVFDIQGKLSLEKFAKEIHFRIPERKKKLEYGLSRMKIETYGKKAQSVILRNFYEIFKQKGYVTKHELAKQIKRTVRNAQDWLSKLEKGNLIKSIGGNEFISNGNGFCGLHGRTPLKYAITKRGLKVLNKNQETFQIKVLPKYKGSSSVYNRWKTD